MLVNKKIIDILKGMNDKKLGEFGIIIFCGLFTGLSYPIAIEIQPTIKIDMFKYSC